MPKGFLVHLPSRVNALSGNLVNLFKILLILLYIRHRCVLPEGFFFRINTRRYVKSCTGTPPVPVTSPHALTRGYVDLPAGAPLGAALQQAIRHRLTYPMVSHSLLVGYSNNSNSNNISVNNNINSCVQFGSIWYAVCTGYFIWHMACYAGFFWFI